MKNITRLTLCTVITLAGLFLTPTPAEAQYGGVNVGVAVGRRPVGGRFFRPGFRFDRGFSRGRFFQPRFFSNRFFRPRLFTPSYAYRQQVFAPGYSYGYAQQNFAFRAPAYQQQVFVERAPVYAPSCAGQSFYQAQVFQTPQVYSAPVFRAPSCAGYSAPRFYSPGFSPGYMPPAGCHCVN